jgi:hypothetical protein
MIMTFTIRFTRRFIRRLVETSGLVIYATNCTKGSVPKPG